jgi:PAS domain S-box-containing protein
MEMSRPLQSFKTLSQRRTLINGIIIAVICSITAPLLTLIFHQYLYDTQMLFYIFATALSAWWGGFLSGSITAVASVLLYHLIPENALPQLLTDGNRFLQALLFLAFSLVLSYLEGFRQRYEMLLEATRAELETILNGVEDGITAQRLDGSYTYVNEAAADILDFDSASILMNTSPTQILVENVFTDENGHPLTFAELPQQQAMKYGLPFSGEYRLNSGKSDVDRWVRISAIPILNETGTPRLVISVLRNITQRKFFEDEMMSLMAIIEQERERLWAIMDNVPGVIWENMAPLDAREANISFVSEYAEKLLGYPISEWKENDNFWTKIIPPEVIDRVIEQTTQLAQEKDAGVLQFPVITQDGRMLDMEAYVSFMRGADGRVAGVRGAMIDVTDRRQHERLLEKTTEELRRSNAELQQFAYVASHDLQEPLRMVASYLQLIERRYNALLDDSGREFIHYAVDGASRMKALINDLLAFSRVQTQQRTFTLFNSEEALQTAMQNLKVVIEENHVRIDYDTLPQVFGDSILITQLLQNLISNAIKFKRLDSVHIKVASRRLKGGWWQFSVEDNGIGIEPEYFERIFAIFQRLHTREQYSGTGIGLSICKKVVEQHGGRIWLESTVDVGTTFYFTLPGTVKAFEKSAYDLSPAEPVTKL